MIKNIFYLLMMIFIYLIVFISGVSSSCIRKTLPLTNDQLKTLINNLPIYEDNDECLKSEECAINWITNASYIMEKMDEALTIYDFNAVINNTDENKQLLSNFTIMSDAFNKNLYETRNKFYLQSNGWDDELRQMLFVSPSLLISNDNLTALLNDLGNIYYGANIVKDNKTYNLFPDLANILSSSRDYNELLWAWSSWHNTVGPQVKNDYVKSVELYKNEANKLGYNDLSEVWFKDVKTDNLEEVFDDLLDQINPLYVELHAYVRRKLRDFYGNDKFSSKYIPAHLLGNMWGKTWENLYDILVPFKDIQPLDLTNAFVQNNYTVLKFLKQSEEFFTSLGLFPMTDSFWKYSMFEKPTDGRDVDCEPYAWDFANGFDYRISLCAEVTQTDFINIHNVMSLVENYMAYSNQPKLFHNEANPGFQQAVIKTILLSVNNPSHFEAIGILNAFNASNEFQINSLLKEALTTISLLKFSFLVEKWRWNVFRGNITPDNYNEKWWELVNKYQGIESPIARNESNFDPGSVPHISNYYQLINNFISDILKFQFFESMCVLSDHEGPLNLCDFYGSKAAGSKLKEMLSLGKSMDWKIALDILTDKNYYDASSLVNYFEPLYEWLQQENSKYPNDPVGW